MERIAIVGLMLVDTKDGWYEIEYVGGSRTSSLVASPQVSCSRQLRRSRLALPDYTISSQRRYFAFVESQDPPQHFIAVRVNFGARPLSPSRSPT